MKRTKIALTALAFVLGIGATFASNWAPATLYVKTASGECLKLCAATGNEDCPEAVTARGYEELQDCIDQSANFIVPKKPF